MKKALAVVAAAVVFGLVSAGVIIGVTKLAGAGTQVTVAETTVQEETTAAETEAAPEITKTEVVREAVKLDVSDIVEEAMPQVVSITNTMVVKQKGYSDIFDYFYGGGVPREYEVPASGSGVILEKTNDELLIVTNNHVVQDSKELSVTFCDNTTVTADIKGTDSTVDLAVIAVPLTGIPEETMKQIKIATLHDKEDLKVGQGVIAIGNALGYGQTVTVGYISALDREIQAESSVYSNLIQVDAAINPGNSGGALINMDGEVIGINVAKLAQTSIEGIGYSIPIYKAKEVIDGLSTAKTKVAVEESKQGRLGIYMNTVSDANAKTLGIPAGIIIRGFSDEEAEGYGKESIQYSPAKNAGMLQNDIITKFDGQNVKTAEELAELVKYYEAGASVDITVMRLENGAYIEKTITVELGSKNDSNTADTSKKDDKKETSAADTEDEKDEETSEDKDLNGGYGNGEDDLYDMFREFLEQYR